MGGYCSWFMSRENFEIVQRVVDALNDRDADGYAALFAREVELIAPHVAVEVPITGLDGIAAAGERGR